MSRTGRNLEAHGAKNAAPGHTWTAIRVQATMRPSSEPVRTNQSELFSQMPVR